MWLFGVLCCTCSNVKLAVEEGVTVAISGGWLWVMGHVMQVMERSKQQCVLLQSLQSLYAC